MNESATFHYLTYKLGFDPTESASKCEESRRERTFSRPMSLHHFQGVLLFQHPLPNAVVKVSATMTQCAKLSFHMLISREVDIR